jgi:hypothetical protein
MKPPKRRPRPDPNLPTCADEWGIFVREVLIPAGIPEGTQRDEMQKVFYAGLRTMLCMVQRVGEPDVSMQFGERYL